MAIEIPLTKGYVALVDDEDTAWLGQWKWCAAQCHGVKFVAIRREPGTKRTVYMHREILGLPYGDSREGDHLNHDTLDNRRANLRAVTPMQNKRRQPPRGGSSRFVGVTWDRHRSLWRAQIQVDGKVINLGRYASEVEAARVRDRYVTENATGHGLNAA